MEEREKEKNSFFATLSKPENKELKGFLKIYIIIALVNIVVPIIGNVLFFLIDEIELYFWTLFGLTIGLILFDLIAYLFLLPRAYRFGVKFLIPKILKDLSKELNPEDLKKKN
jgi:membrane protein YdbS with pleckstrin-like domain